MDRLEIKSLKVATRIGVHAWEQQIEQNLLIDLVIPQNFQHCNEDLTSTLDYDAVCKLVTDYVEKNQFKLIETVANTIAELVKQEFKLATITVSVSKPMAIRNASDIRVTVQR